MSRFVSFALKTFSAASVLVALVSPLAWAEFTVPGLIKDINTNESGLPQFQPDEGNNFSPGHNAFASDTGVPYSLDAEGVLNGNDVLVLTQEGFASSTGTGITVSVSNGENGDGLSGQCLDPGCSQTTVDPSNTVAADSAFSNIGNTSNRLENGNVVRFSSWYRSDPNAPLTVEPQIPPVIKLEFWRDALSGDGDFNAGAQANFGGRIFDTDLNAVVIGDPNQTARSIDIAGDGGQTDGPLTTTDWLQVVHTYTVDDSNWDITNTGTVEDVTQVEEIRGVMFMGDFTTDKDLGGPGNLLVDNALIEIFADSAAEQASDVQISNPSPLLDEVATGADGDGDVDGADFLTIQRDSPSLIPDWQADYGTGVAAVSALSSVPEPSSALLVLISVVCLKGRATRQRR